MTYVLKHDNLLLCHWCSHTMNSKNSGGNLLVPLDSIQIDYWDQKSIKNLFTIFCDLEKKNLYKKCII